MRILKTLIFILICFTSYGQGIEPVQLQDNPYQDGILRATDRIWSEWLQDSINQYVHAPFPLSIDSVKYENDSLYIYTPDSMYVVEILSGGGGGSGTVKGDGVANKVAIWADSDSLTYDSLYFNPTNHILGLGTDSPTATGSSFGFQIHGGSFSSLRLTNTTTGAGSTAGTSIYTYADSLYLSNLENAAVIVATNSAERARFDSDGILIPRLDSDNASPTMSGTTKKVIVDDKGRLGTATNTSGTVTSVAAATGTSGTDFNISGSPITSSGTITFNLPTVSSSNRGAVTSAMYDAWEAKIGGSGSSGYLSYFSAGSTLADSPLYRLSSGSIALGTTTNTNLLGRSGINLMNADPAFVIGKSTSHYWYHYMSGNNYQIYNPNFGAVLDLQTDGKLKAIKYAGSGNRYLYASSTGEINVAAYDAASTTGTGTTGYIPRYFSAYIMDRTGLYCSADLGYQIGLGTTSPNTYLLNGTSKGIAIHDASGDPRFGLSTTSRTWLHYMSGTDYSIWNSSGGDLLRLDDAGRVGVVTTSPQRTLHVQGEARISDLTTDTPTLMVGADNDGDLGAVTVGTGLSLSAGTLTATATISGSGSTGYVPYFTSSTALAASNVYFNSNGFGFNTTSPLYALHLNNRSIYLQGTSNIIDKFNSGGASNAVLMGTGGSGVAWTYLGLYRSAFTGKDLSLDGGATLTGALVPTNGSAGQVLTKTAGSYDWATPTSGTVTSIATNNGITGGTITTTGTVGLTGQALALHNLSTNGLIARTGSGTVAGRTITANTGAGQFGISVSNGDGVSGNPAISVLSNYAVLNGSNDQTLSTTYTKYNFDLGSDGDDTGITADAANDEIDISTNGLYEFKYTVNCKSNTSAHVLSVQMQNVTGSALGGTTNHYFSSTSDYCMNTGIGLFNMTPSNSVALYVKTNSGTPNINDCQVDLHIKRVD